VTTVAKRERKELQFQETLFSKKTKKFFHWKGNRVTVAGMRSLEFPDREFLQRNWGKTAAFCIFVLVASFSPANAQTQYSIGSPTNEQQYMLELINRARADGGAEAARRGLSGLQEGPPSVNNEPWTIQNSVQPLSWNPLLFNAAQGQADILNNGDQFFSGQSPHTYPNGTSSPQQRIAAAGYSAAQYNGPTTAQGFFPGPENVAEAISQGSGPYTGAKLIAAVLDAHNGLFTDQTTQGRGHRDTTMLAFFREIGIGVSTGTDNDGQGTIWDSLYIVQDFGTQTNSTPFVTGVVYQDTNGNGFYDPGEGIGGVRVDVSGSNFFAVTSSSGGYSVPVAGNGSYTVMFGGGGVTTAQRNVTVANSLNAKIDFITNAPTTPTVLANISTRLRVDTGDNALIAGFILTGTQSKKVIIRGIGPSLNVPDKLANPVLELRDSNGGLLDSNDDWQQSPNKQAIIDSTIPPTNDLESAIVQTLPASTNGTAYTAILRGVNNTAGIGVIQVYDLDTSANSKLANISTRGSVQTGDNVLFAGMIVVGQTPQKVIIRATGPSLSVPGKMENPTLELRDNNGTLLEANDDWVNSPNKQAIIDSSIPPTNDLESAIVRTLPAGGATYTAIVRGVNNTTGIAVVEVFALN